MLSQSSTSLDAPGRPTVSCPSRFVVAVFSLSVLLTPLAFSQGFATIVGTITDPSGGLVQGAKVTAVEEGTTASREALTNASGAFVIPALRPTTYTLTVEAAGFN